MRSRLTDIAVVFASCSTLLVPSAHGSEGEDKRPPRYVQRWTKTLQENDQRLRAGEWEPAERAARKLIDRMVHRPGLRLLEPIGAAAYQHALALAGLGRNEEAHWRADVARAFHPTIPVHQLQSSYGKPGRLVSVWFQDAAAHWNPEDSPSLDCSRESEEADAELVPPRKVSGDMPEMTAQLRLRLRRDPGVAATSIVVDEKGRPHAPRLVAPSLNDVALLWATLEATRTWRFEPGKHNGQPVECRTSLISLSSLLR